MERRKGIKNGSGEIYGEEKRGTEGDGKRKFRVLVACDLN